MKRPYCPAPLKWRGRTGRPLWNEEAVLAGPFEMKRPYCPAPLKWRGFTVRPFWNEEALLSGPLKIKSPYWPAPLKWRGRTVRHKENEEAVLSAIKKNEESSKSAFPKGIFIINIMLYIYIIMISNKIIIEYKNAYKI